MWDHLCDFFVETMIVLFIPVVCSYYVLSANLFFNVSLSDAQGLEKLSNTLLAPVQYICAGREASRNPDGTWVLSQRFSYEEEFGTRTAFSLVACIPSAILGSAVKAMSFCSERARERYISLQKDLKTDRIQPNLDLYRNLGIQFGNEDETTFHMPEGHARRPGDENHLHAEKEALQEIGDALSSAGILWWIDCGTCLGAYRYGGVIPWDNDLDIAVLIPDFENVQRALLKLDPKKYIVQDWSTRSHPKSYIKVFIRSSMTLVDIYHFAMDAESKQIRYIFSLDSNIFFPERWKIRERRFTVPVAFDVVFPLKKTLFDGIEVFIPNDPKTYLQRYYGENLSPAKIFDPVTNLYEKDLSHPYWQREYAH